MQPLEAILRQRLSAARRVAVLAVGSDLRGDDAAGLLAGRQLQQLLAQAPPPNVELAVFLGETAPENLTGQIKRFAPTHLLVLDAADLGQPPGAVGLIEPEQIAGNLSASTHSLPLNMLTGYLRDATGCQVVIVGLQAGGRQFGCRPAKEVAAAAHRVAAAILGALGP